MQLQESINRGFNLLASSIVGLAGFAFAPEAILETDMPDRIDDTLLFILGLVAIWWYNSGSNRYARSATPLILVCVSFLVKVMGAIIEFSDPASVGDDFGGLILFVLAVGLVWYQYRKTSRLLSE